MNVLFSEQNRVQAIEGTMEIKNQNPIANASAHFLQ